MILQMKQIASYMPLAKSNLNASGSSEAAKLPLKVGQTDCHPEQALLNRQN